MNEVKYIKYMEGLSDLSRLKIVYLLSLNSFCAIHLEKILGISQVNISRHCTKLINSEIITAVKKGRRVIYSLDCNFVNECDGAIKSIQAIYTDEYEMSNIKELAKQCREM